MQDMGDYFVRSNKVSPTIHQNSLTKEDPSVSTQSQPSDIK